MKYALVENDVVINVILWNGDGKQYDDYLCIKLDDNSVVGVGYTYSEGRFCPLNILMNYSGEIFLLIISLPVLINFFSTYLYDKSEKTTSKRMKAKKYITLFS